MHIAMVKSSVWCYETIKTIYWCNKKKNSINSQFILDPGNSGFTNNNNNNYNNNNIKKQNKFNLTAGTFSCFFLSPHSSPSGCQSVIFLRPVYVLIQWEYCEFTLFYERQQHDNGGLKASEGLRTSSRKVGSVIKFGGLQLSAQLLVRGPVSCDPHRQLIYSPNILFVCCAPFSCCLLRISKFSQSPSHSLCPVDLKSNHSAAFRCQCQTVVTVQSGEAPLVSSLWNLRTKQTCLTGVMIVYSHFVHIIIHFIHPRLI